MNPLKRLMQSVLRLHPMLEDPELRQAYQECEQSYQPKKGKCLMRNAGITVVDVRASFTDELARADAKHYYDTALDWSNGNGQMRTDWIAVIRNMARDNLAQQTEEYSSGGSGSDNAGDVRSHGMHQQEVSRVSLRPHLLHHPSRHGHC